VNQLIFGWLKTNDLKRHFFILACFFLTLLAQSQSGFAQFVEFGQVHRVPQPIPAETISASRISFTASIPFWDDFSQGLDTLKWKVEGASYTETIGIRPPSLGMVLFNGVDQNGRAYSQQVRDQGESDYLISKTFDLSTIPSTEKSSLHISFYWQAGGNAELPDENDRISLQILDPQGVWLTIWSKNGGDDLDRNTFAQEIIQIKPEWQHQAFQFRFFSNGRQSGPFDSWLLDYVYLNTKRSQSNLSYTDRALTKPNAVRLDGFGAYPWELLSKNQTGKWTTLQNEFLNLENRFRAMEYTISAKDSSGTVLLSINENTPFNPVPNALERRTFLSRTFTEIDLPSTPSDILFETKLTTGDGILFEVNQGDTTRFSSVDYRINDQVTTKFPIRDFFAYDHGSADYAAGINQRSGQLAVSYTTPEQIFLKGISIYFTNPIQANQAIDLVVWSSLDQKPIYSQETIIPARNPGEELVYFPLERPIQVTGEFFVGFTQFSNDFVYIGLDKINDQGDKIHYNVGGGWVQNKEVKGALMIRPHVAKSLEGGNNALPETIYRLFPNPVTDELQIQGEFSDLTVVDSFGREILLPREQTKQGEIVNFRGQRPGVYVVNLLTPSGLKSVRILVKN